MKVSSLDSRLVRLLQLVSPTLPVGAYSYSQGLESAVAAEIVRDAHSAQSWIGDVLDHSFARAETPALARLIHSWENRDAAAAAHWNAMFLATRESAELRAETLQMGYSLRKLLMEMEGTDEEARARLAGVEEISFPAAFAFAVAHWQIPTQPALVAYLWAWLENQVMAAVRLVPLGQTDGQRMLLALGGRLVDRAERAMNVPDDELGGFAPRLAILSSRHETQYSRLFRS